MSIRGKWIEQLREKLSKANEEAAERAADLAVSISEKANEDDVREFIGDFMEFIEFLPNLVLFSINLTLDKRVPIGEKLKTGILVAYLVMPADLILMELVGPIAFMDDMVVIAYLGFSLCSLLGRLDQDVIRDNWVGNPEHIDQFIEAARSIAGMGGFQKISNI
ncbi:MAG TPA: hypothetical protein PLN69_01210 [bacterium]|nr:hypothetical protein [bacterium]